MVTRNIADCRRLTDDLIDFLAEQEHISREDTEKKVLIVTSAQEHQANVRALADVDLADNPVEWITWSVCSPKAGTCKTCSRSCHTRSAPSTANCSSPRSWAVVCASPMPTREDEEVGDPSPESKGKYRYAQQHFVTLNQQQTKCVYYFHFLSPCDYDKFFKLLRDGNYASIVSELDAALEGNGGAS